MQKSKLPIKSEFVRNVTVLAGGSTLSYLIALLASPVLTRLYSPEEFGLLAVYTSILSILIVNGSWRYNLAVPLPKQANTAYSLLTISLFTIFINTLSLYGILWLFGDFILSKLTASGLSGLILILPISFLSAGVIQAFTFFAIRDAEYSSIAKTKVTQNILMVLIQGILGFSGSGATGLVAGDASGRFCGAVYLTRRSLTLYFRKLRSVSLSDIAAAAIKYKRFPLISSISSLINSCGLFLPPLLLNMIFETRIAGLFSLTYRIVKIPVTLIGQAVSQVYIGEAAKRLHDEPSALWRLFNRTTGKLFLLSLPPGLLFGLIGPSLFVLVFGSEWRIAGEYARYLSIMLVLQFVTVPVSQTLNILERQDLQLFWDILRLATLLGLFYLAEVMELKPGLTILLYGIVMAVDYALLFLLTLLIVKKRIAPGINGKRVSP